MAVSLNPRAERLLARLPRLTVFSALELLLLVLIAVQCARLFWGVLTPIGPVGDWKALDRIRPVAPATPTLGSFDPFFRQAPGAPGASGQAPVVVTALDIRLYGVTANQATGGGSAIVGRADGQQRSVLVGEEIMPGATLTGVGFDYVTITRNGTAERLYLDQTPAAPGAPTPGGATTRPIIQPAPYQPPPPPPPPPPRQVAPPPPAATQAPSSSPTPTAQTLKVNQ